MAEDVSLVWQRDARCGRNDINPQIFFVGDNEAARMEFSIGYQGHRADRKFTEEEATAIKLARIQARMTCNECPVKLECREYAMNRKVIGIWGGLTSAQRWALKRRMKRQKLNAS